MSETAKSEQDSGAPPEILVSGKGPILHVRLNRPEKYNALTERMHQWLHRIFDDFARDPALKICILSASGPNFCAGSDLRAARERQDRGEPRLALPASGYGGLVQRFDLDKPIIAAVQGRALGGGLEIALACDLIIAGQSAEFASPEPHWGKVAIAGGPHRLVRAIGEKRAMDMILTGRMVTAAEALAFGFVNIVVPDADLESECERVAQSILRGGPLALGASKQLVSHSLDHASLAAAIGDQEALPAMRTWRASEESNEGNRAFSEKRRPRWDHQ